MENVEKVDKRTLNTGRPPKARQQEVDLLTQDPVEIKNYQQPTVVKNKGQDIPDIPVPNFEKPIINLHETSKTNDDGTPIIGAPSGQPGRTQTTTVGGGDIGGGVQPPDEAKQGGFDNLRNPKMDDLPPKAKKKASGHVTKSLLKAYRELNRGALWITTVDERKKRRLQRKHKIEFNTVIPLNEDGSESMTGHEMISDFNSFLSEVYAIDEDFMEEVEPLMNEFFEEKGIGMTVGQRLAMLWGEELMKKTTMTFMGFMQQKEMLETIKDVMEFQKNFNQQQQAAVNAQQAAEAQRRQQQQQQQPASDVHEPEIVETQDTDDNTETIEPEEK